MTREVAPEPTTSPTNSRSPTGGCCADSPLAPARPHRHSQGLFSHILRDQLAVTVETFWQCVTDGVVPTREAGAPATGEPVPLEVVHLLTTKVGLSDDEIPKFSRAEAITRLEMHWTHGS